MEAILETSRLRRLPETLVNRIAAGEVIERPAAAVKELVENALDAKATRIDITLKDGGKSLIIVEDDGTGMTADELALAVERHATSKIPDEDLVNITTLGFRGEALPSIGAVSRLTITSRQQNAESAHSIRLEGGTKFPVQPASGPRGTRIEVRDLFFATPARLKFLKTDRTEAITSATPSNASPWPHPDVAFTLIEEGRSPLRLNKAEIPQRLATILGSDFGQSSLEINAERETLTLTGRISLPTLSDSYPRHQYLFVMGAPSATNSSTAPCGPGIWTSSLTIATASSLYF